MGGARGLQVRVWCSGTEVKAPISGENMGLSHTAIVAFTHHHEAVRGHNVPAASEAHCVVFVYQLAVSCYVDGL